MHLTSVASTAAGTTAAAVPQPRLVKAAHEFEAQMMKELMQPLNRLRWCIGRVCIGVPEPGVERWRRVWDRRWDYQAVVRGSEPKWDSSGNWKYAHKYRDEAQQMTRVISEGADTFPKE